MRVALSLLWGNSVREMRQNMVQFVSSGAGLIFWPLSVRWLCGRGSMFPLLAQTSSGQYVRRANPKPFSRLISNIFELFSFIFWLIFHPSLSFAHHKGNCFGTFTGLQTSLRVQKTVVDDHSKGGHCILV